MRHAALPGSSAAIPDIKRLKSSGQLNALRTTQENLLAALWPLLNQGGRLVYSTCSLLHEENDRVIDTFLDNHPSANPETIQGEWGTTTLYGRQLLPCLDDTGRVLLCGIDQKG